IVARATMAVAPTDPFNSVIVDIDHAPRNAQGFVEATTDVEILRPTLAANGNRALLYDVVNRGGKRALAMFNDALAANDLAKAADAGSGFLMRRGYTVVWSGWQGDLGAGGAIYDFVYQAKDPKVMGLGFAATRDLISFLRNDAVDASGTPNVLAGRIDRALAFGQSQSGRYLHDFLYFGFNTDETGGPVFDGLMPHLAGGKKTFTNFRFSQPGRSAYQHADTLYPGAEFPFTYPVTTDSLTGKTDGMLARCLAAAPCPKIIKT